MCTDYVVGDMAHEQITQRDMEYHGISWRKQGAMLACSHTRLIFIKQTVKNKRAAGTVVRMLLPKRGQRGFRLA